MKKFLAYLLLFSFLTVSLFACSSKDDTTPASLPPSVVGVQLRADVGDKKVTLDWKMVANATSYNIYYISGYVDKPDPSVIKASGTKVTGLIGPSYTVTGLTNIKYWFALSAVNASGESDLSSSIIPVTPNNPPPPAAPTYIRANAGNAEVTVSWNTVPGASSYNLYCWDGSSLGRESINNIPDPGQPTASYVVKTLTWNIGTDVQATSQLANGTLYIFYLTAETAESANSAKISATPGTTSSTTTVPDGTVVTSITTATGTTGQVIVSWKPLSSATPYTSYNLYYYPTSTPGNVTRIPDFVNGNIVSWGLTDGTSYSFYLTSVTESSGSFAVMASPSVNTLPGPPTISSATPGNGTVTLAWTAVAGAISYNIYWSTLPNVTKTIGAATKGLLPLTASVTLVNGTQYYFVVTAVNANGESMESNELFATPTP